jgi:chlorophyll synthase
MPSSKFRGIVSLLRPFTLGAPFIGAIFFSILSLKYYNKLDMFFACLPTILFGASSLALANASSNALNSAWDAEQDKISKPSRPIPSGVLSEREALSVGYFGVCMVFLFASFVNTMFVLFVSMVMICAFVYSSPPIRAKRLFFWNAFVIAISRGFLGILATFSIVGNPFEKPFIAIAIIMFVFVFGSNEVRNVPDYEADKQCGIRNFVTVWGVKKAMMFSSIFVILPYVMIVYLVWKGWLQNSAIYLLMLIPIGCLMLYYMLWKPERRKWTENSVAWMLFYIHMMLYMIGFCAIYFM